MNEPTTLVERHGPLAIVRLNRPDRLNALDFATARAFCENMAAVIDDPAVRAVLVAANGSAFCAGTDLRELEDRANHPDRPAGGRLLREYFNPLIEKMVSAPKPIVAAVNGPAIGVGCSIAIASDFVLAGESATFTQAFVNLGAVPDAGSTWLLPRLIGRGRANAMMLLGQPVAAETAQAWGLVHEVVSDAELLQKAMETANSLARGPTFALSCSKRLADLAWRQDLDQQLRCEAEMQDASFATADFSEGVAALKGKRVPQFSGT